MNRDGVKEFEQKNIASIGSCACVFLDSAGVEHAAGSGQRGYGQACRQGCVF